MILNGYVVKYRSHDLFMNWFLTIFMIGLIATALPLFRDLVFHVLGIHGGLFIETPSYAQDYHRFFGFMLFVLIIIQVSTLNRPERKNLIVKKPIKDLKAYIHSFFYLIGFARREEVGGGQQYFGRERMVFLALVYSFGLLGITGILMFLFSFGEEMMSILNVTHALMTGFLIFVIGYHGLLHFKRHDLTAWKCTYLTGRLPLWHIKRYHKIWYLEIVKHEKSLKGRVLPVKRIHDPDVLKQAVYDLNVVDDPIAQKDVVNKLVSQVKKESTPKDIKYLVKISKITSNGR
jgi:cytochrome b subunit of formate dehydrogenase